MESPPAPLETVVILLEDATQRGAGAACRGDRGRCLCERGMYGRLGQASRARQRRCRRRGCNHATRAGGLRRLSGFAFRAARCRLRSGVRRLCPRRLVLQVYLPVGDVLFRRRSRVSSVFRSLCERRKQSGERWLRDHSGGMRSDAHVRMPARSDRRSDLLPGVRRPGYSARLLPVSVHGPPSAAAQKSSASSRYTSLAPCPSGCSAARTGQRALSSAETRERAFAFDS